MCSISSLGINLWIGRKKENIRREKVSRVKNRKRKEKGGTFDLYKIASNC